MPVTVKKNHQKVKRMTHADVAAGQNRAFSFLVKEAKRNIRPHRRTGHLEGSIEQHLVATPEKPRAGARVGASYGRVVDQGSYKMAGTFFFTRALLAMYERFDRFFKKR
jgi:hypothetical protein